MKVTVSQDGPPYRLLVTSHGYTSIAGPRVLRGGIHPVIQWSHVDTNTANLHAQKLQTYFDELDSIRKPSKRELRTYGS